MIHSAGILCYRYVEDKLQVFLVHSTGINGVWSFPKGEVDEGESLIDGALREFAEETTYILDSDVDYVYLGSVFTSDAKKTVHAFSADMGDVNPEQCISNMCEYPIGSGEMIYELDEFVWYPIDEAYKVINPRQIPLLHQLVKNLY
jgi:predicted NUDIX family NTP pyrophosphohydrolase